MREMAAMNGWLLKPGGVQLFSLLVIQPVADCDRWR